MNTGCAIKDVRNVLSIAKSSTSDLRCEKISMKTSFTDVFVGMYELRD